MAIGLSHYLIVAALLFTIGVFGIFINRKNVIVILMSIELILLSVNINFVAFSVFLGNLVGQVFALFILTVWVTRYVSLGSILAAAFVPGWTLIEHLLIRPVADFPAVFTSLCLVSGLIIAKHEENIRRLLAGTENKFGAAKSGVK